ncbi:unnamed protein product [Ectocarpus sp. 12 AP-2014]
MMTSVVCWKQVLYQGPHLHPRRAGLDRALGPPERTGCWCYGSRIWGAGASSGALDRGLSRLCQPGGREHTKGIIDHRSAERARRPLARKPRRPVRDAYRA